MDKIAKVIILIGVLGFSAYLCDGWIIPVCLAAILPWILWPPKEAKHSG